jgi:hypothetical protein
MVDDALKAAAEKLINQLVGLEATTRIELV